jgi:rSAM/selenodomain-associated transferase 2
MLAGPPLSVIVPTLDAAAVLPAALHSLVEARRCGVLREVVIADGGSRDETVAIASAWGARVVSAPRGRGAQLVAGAAAASGAWLFFLHADTRLTPGWALSVAAFLGEDGNCDRAGYLRFRLDDDAAAARRIEAAVAWRCRHLALPYGDQGLLVAAALYRALGGFRPLPLMEDVDLVRRLGRRRLVPLALDAVTSAARYRRDGYMLRPLRNLCCLGLYFLGLPPRLILPLYR